MLVTSGQSMSAEGGSKPRSLLERFLGLFTEVRAGEGVTALS